jgi:hypothetical protein
LIISTRCQHQGFFHSITRNGSLKDINGDIIGTIGTSPIYDSERDEPFTIEIQKYYANPVVFAQPLSTEFDDAVFRFTDISNNSFSGYVHHDYEAVL